MRWQIIFPVTLLLLAAFAVPAPADQLVLKDGRQYSGKFVRADANVVEFRIFGKVESFPTSEVAQIVFKEPELVSPPAAQEAPSVPADAEPRAGAAIEKPVANAQAQPGAAASTVARGSIPTSAATVPQGATLLIRTTTPIDSSRTGVDDSFDAVLEEPLMQGERILAERGAPVKGRIAYAQESGRMSGQAMLILELTQITIDGRSYELHTSDYSQVGSSRGKETAATVGGTAAIGAIIGAVAGGGKGAAIGAAAGAAAGTGVQVARGAETIKVPMETLLRFTLEKPLEIETP